MTLTEFLNITTYKNHIVLLKPSKIDESIKWSKIVDCVTTEEMENMILEKYGSWIVFNCICKNNGNSTISIYPTSMGDLISKFDPKDSI